MARIEQTSKDRFHSLLFGAARVAEVERDRGWFTKEAIASKPSGIFPDEVKGDDGKRSFDLPGAFGRCVSKLIEIDRSRVCGMATAQFRASDRESRLIPATFIHRLPYIPRSPASRRTLRDSILWYFVRTSYIACVIPNLFARSRWGATKCAKYEIKVEKGTIPCGLSTAVDPAERDANRPQIELAMLDL